MKIHIKFSLSQITSVWCLWNKFPYIHSTRTSYGQEKKLHSTLSKILWFCDFYPIQPLQTWAGFRCTDIIGNAGTAALSPMWDTKPSVSTRWLYQLAEGDLWLHHWAVTIAFVFLHNNSSNTVLCTSLRGWAMFEGTWLSNVQKCLRWWSQLRTYVQVKSGDLRDSPTHILLSVLLST